MIEWDWVDEINVTAGHDELLAEHGGSEGLRDRGLLQAALGRPRDHALYSNPSVFDLAAVYADGIVRNHPFVDGNKRTALLTAETFLGVNGWEFNAPENEAIAAILALAVEDWGQREFSSWLRENSTKLEKEI